MPFHALTCEDLPISVELLCFPNCFAHFGYLKECMYKQEAVYQYQSKNNSSVSRPFSTFSSNTFSLLWHISISFMYQSLNTSSWKSTCPDYHWSTLRDSEIFLKPFVILKDEPLPQSKWCALCNKFSTQYCLYMDPSLLYNEPHLPCFSFLCLQKRLLLCLLLLLLLHIMMLPLPPFTVLRHGT